MLALLSLPRDFLTAGTEAFLHPVAPRTALSHQGLQGQEKLLQSPELGRDLLLLAQGEFPVQLFLSPFI